MGSKTLGVHFLYQAEGTNGLRALSPQGKEKKRNLAFRQDLLGNQSTFFLVFFFFFLREGRLNNSSLVDIKKK